MKSWNIRSKYTEEVTFLFWFSASRCRFCFVKANIELKYHIEVTPWCLSIKVVSMTQMYTWLPRDGICGFKNSLGCKLIIIANKLWVKLLMNRDYLLQSFKVTLNFSKCQVLYHVHPFIKEYVLHQHVLGSYNRTAKRMVLSSFNSVCVCVWKILVYRDIARGSWRQLVSLLLFYWELIQSPAQWWLC